MKQEAEVFFHLGLKKTGSTYLQHIVFPNLKGINYYRKRLFEQHKGVLQELKPEKYLFTFEMDVDLEEFLEELHPKLPSAKIILVLRRHDSWITSKYKYHIRKFGNLTFEEYFDLENNTGFFKKEEMYFQKKLECIEKYFSEPPLILFYGDLRKQEEKMVKKLIKYLGVELDMQSLNELKQVVNGSFGEKQLKILRAFNKWYPYTASTNKNRILRKIHYKYREFLLHIVAFFARFVPAGWVSKEPLIPDGALEKVRAFYANDWTYCKEYAGEQELVN